MRATCQFTLCFKRLHAAFLSRLLPTLILAIAFTGCSVVMAARQPGKKDLRMFSVGMPRSAVLAEFGEPISSIEKNGKRIEVYKFTQGYSTGVKAARAIFHGVADVFTLFLWEIAATPIEGIAEGSQMAYEVTYDENQKIQSVTLIKDENTK